MSCGEASKKFDLLFVKLIYSTSEKINYCHEVSFLRPNVTPGVTFPTT